LNTLKEFDYRHAEKFLELFNQGREFTEELLRDNQRLRQQLALAEQSSGSQEVEALRQRVEQLASENKQFAEKYRRIQEQHEDYASRFREIEEQNNNLANLYVASYQLHSTLDFGQVVEIVKEILINLIGAEVFSILLLNEENGVFETIGAAGEQVLPGVERLRVEPGEGTLARVAGTGESVFSEDAIHRRPDLERPLVAVPLKIDDRTIGLLAVFGTLQQKEAFTAVDYELFALLAAHAAAAIFSSRLYSQSERKLSTIQNFLDMLTTS
jgi:hypothetical protein